MLNITHITESKPQEEQTTPELQITVVDEPGFFGKLFGIRAKTFAYRGSCTVWHQFPSGKRAPICLEIFLCDASVGHKMRTQQTQ